MLGAIINIYLTRKFHTSLLLISHTAIGVISMATAVFSMNSNIFTVGLFIAGAVLGSLFSLCVGLLGQFFPKSSGAATGCLSSSSSISLALSSLIAGKTIDIVGIYPLFVFTVFIMVISGIIAFIIRKLYLKLLEEPV